MDTIFLPASGVDGRSDETTRISIGLIYLAVGVLGFILNITTVIMIATNRVYRLSAYTLMANVALADSVVLLIAGIACGSDLIWPNSVYHVKWELEQIGARLATNTSGSVPSASPVLLSVVIDSVVTAASSDTLRNTNTTQFILSFMQIASWTAGIISYALLGLNRCIAICYYGTKARAMNRVSVAVISSLSTWIVGFVAAVIGSTPEPLIGIRRDMWTINFNDVLGDKSTAFILFIFCTNIVGVLAQWVFSTLVLCKIRQVKQKISRNKLNQNSANRFRKQARLSFQFFYPSVLCTISTVVYFVKPYIFRSLDAWQLICLHMIWLVNHACNPFIYAYFNDRMRLTYREMLTCASIRYYIRKRKNSNPFQNNQRFNNASRRSNAAGTKQNRMSARSIRSREGNFVRNSLQMQSRDFEQLCEFMMRVNPLYDSSEGWRESSDDEETNENSRSLDQIREVTAHWHREDRESKSIVLDLGRQTVEHWVKFAKKASI